MLVDTAELRKNKKQYYLFVLIAVVFTLVLTIFYLLQMLLVHQTLFNAYVLIIASLHNYFYFRTLGDVEINKCKYYVRPLLISSVAIFYIIIGRDFVLDMNKSEVDITLALSGVLSVVLPVFIQRILLNFFVVAEIPPIVVLINEKFKLFSLQISLILVVSFLLPILIAFS